MVRIMIAPGRYIQGPRVLEETAKYLGHHGSRIFFVAGATAWSKVEKQITTSLSASSMAYQLESFSGLCTREAAERLSEKARAFGADVVAGIGGGSAIDTAKAVSHELGSSLAIIPTVASNDAPCSALSVQYTANHMLDRFLILRRNPDVVLVDSQIIAEAPTRFFIAGMGDALATWFEAFTCTKSSAQTMAGGIATSAALSLARLCFENLMEYGVRAKLAVDRQALTPAVEKIIETNILLSGVGFESAGLSSAHGIHEGLVALEETKGMMHGELVAYGALCLLVLENYLGSEVERVFDFCEAVGLPTTLRQLGVTDSSPAHLLRAAEIACTEGLTTHNTYFKVNPELILGAILGADAIGEGRRSRNVS